MRNGSITELITRLRESDNATEYFNPGSSETRPTLAWDAADTLTSQQVEIDELRARLAAREADILDLSAQFRAKLDPLQARLAALEGQEAVAEATVWNIEWHDGQTPVVGSVVQLYLAPGAQPSTIGTNISEMVDRFLGWKLPMDFAPDCGISFKSESDYEHPVHGRNKYSPTGTNLFTAEQARQMFEYALAGAQPASAAER